MTYRVFDTSINKLFGAFDNEADALQLAKELIGDNEHDYASDLAVGREMADGALHAPISGDVLLARIATVLRERQPVAAGGSGSFGGYSESGYEAMAAKTYGK